MEDSIRYYSMSKSNDELIKVLVHQLPSIDEVAYTMADESKCNEGYWRKRILKMIDKTIRNSMYLTSLLYILTFC